jgi:kynurenine formamidase
MHSFLHGGAWRDPDVDSMAFEPAVKLLCGNPRVQPSFSGFASINYRLSSYPNRSKNPSAPSDASRNAKQPDHVKDVSKALIFLEKEYGISSGYLLVGHSAGATLAFQVEEECEGLRIPPPKGVMGVEGIYSLKDLTISFEKIPFYKEFVVSAFGSDEEVWQRASPSSSTHPAAWRKAKVIIIAHSEEDELVDKVQADLMLERVWGTPACKSALHYLKANGKHDQIWEEGHELAHLIEEAVILVQEL